MYPLLGFDNLDLWKITGMSYVRNYISDASDMEHIIETYEKKQKPSGKPAFIFNVTMQNHGGYTDTYMNLTNDIQSQYASEPLNQYLTLIHKTDQALENLIDYFSKVDDRTIIDKAGIISRMIQWLLSWKTGHRQRHKNVISYLIWCGVLRIEGAKDKKYESELSCGAGTYRSRSADECIPELPSKSEQNLPGDLCSRADKRIGADEKIASDLQEASVLSVV